MEDNKDLEKMEEISDDELDEVTGGMVTGLIGGQPVLVQPGHMAVPGGDGPASQEKIQKKQKGGVSKNNTGSYLV